MAVAVRIQESYWPICRSGSDSQADNKEMDNRDNLVSRISDQFRTIIETLRKTRQVSESNIRRSKELIAVSEELLTRIKSQPKIASKGTSRKIMAGQHKGPTSLQ
jgi:hypothetical protein